MAVAEAPRAASCVSRSPEGREELGEEAEGGAEGPAPRPVLGLGRDASSRSARLRGDEREEASR